MHHRPRIFEASIPGRAITSRRELEARVDRPELVGDIVTHWHRLAERRRTIVFASDRRPIRSTSATNS